MVDRSYTVAEIDALRRAVENRYLWGSAAPSRGETRMGCVFRESDMQITVEQQVRTYMVAGITGDDLVAADCQS